MDVVIERLGHRGDGVAPGPVFAPRTLPGEAVSGEVRDGRIEQPRILRPSPERVAPPCPHFRSCGGCALQHASDRFVAGWKADVVVQALAAQGLTAEIAAVETSPARSRRRAVLSARRTKGGALVGFHARESDAIVAIPHCHLLDPALMAALPAIEALTLAGASRKAELSVAVTQTDAGCDVAVTGARAADAALRSDLAAVAAAHALARLTWNGEVVAHLAPPSRRLGGVRVTLPPGAFVQATDHGEAVLVERVVAATEGAERVIDFFAGAGTFTFPLARRAAVHAVEGDTELLRSLADGWRGATGLRRVTTERRDLFRRPLLPDELAGYDAAVIDPPRAGAPSQTKALADAAVPRVAAVSCNPVSFARDARILAAQGYRMGSITVVDQFRWSTHVEIVAAFARD